MAAAITLTLLIALIPGSLGQLFCLGLQQLVEGFLYAASYQLFDLTLDYFFVKLYNFFRHGLLSPFEWCVATSFYQRSANHVSFYFFNLRNLLYFIHINDKMDEYAEEFYSNKKQKDDDLSL